jgi:hypothetical protein
MSLTFLPILLSIHFLKFKAIMMVLLPLVTGPMMMMLMTLMPIIMSKLTFPGPPYSLKMPLPQPLMMTSLD